MAFGFRALVLACILFAGSGCHSATEDAELELKMLENTGPTGRELCAAKRKVAEAYLAAHDEEHYPDKKLAADTECISVLTQEMLHQH